ncbi:Membrane transporter protein [Plasmodiophora brassicae]|uniref:Membrane transporter protein n=1 Tax=Plasmodiophora brassicae TaxID=37360 RepID=A0A0G4IRR8_PLABS|nr:hypothetical protein PBRA_006001 [Plasmodiophora brassicae]
MPTGSVRATWVRSTPMTMRVPSAVVLACLLVTGSASCANDDQCGAFHLCKAGACVVRSILDDYRPVDDTLGTVAVFIGAALAAGGGLGGGGIFVPVLVLIAGMSTKQAIPISQSIIFGGSLVNMAFNIGRTHPIVHERPLIDYSVIVMFTPMLLAGTSVGVILNIVFPTWIIVVILLITLGYTTFRTTMKARAAWKRDKHQYALHISMAQVSNSSLRSVSLPEADPSPELGLLLKKDLSTAGEKGAIVGIWLVVLAVQLLKSSRPGSSSLFGIAACSSAYWTVTVFFWAVLGALTVAIGRVYAARTERKLTCGWKPNPSDVVWTSRSIYLYPLMSAMAGLLGGLVGIGGGMILGPLLIELKMPHQVVAATSAMAVFLTASSAIVLYATLGSLIVSYAVWYFFVGLLSTLAGQLVFIFLVRKYNRTSFIVIAIAVVIGAATCMMTVSGVLSTVQQARAGQDFFTFSSPC